MAGHDTGFVDIPGDFCYKLAAVDVHGNLSRYALVSPSAPTATLASLVSVNAQHDRVRLVWYTSNGSGVAATLYRRTIDSDWTPVGKITPDGSGYLRYEDTAVTSGARFGYRLGIMDSGEEFFAGEVWAEVLALRLAMRGATPNPASDGRLWVEFSLRDGSPARLELMDVAGRVLNSRQVGSLGPGTHAVDLSEGGALRPGIYFLRLTQGASEVRARVAVIG
ncbi:MAG: T9SS type A sorting domain-containing protein [Candidatus Eisenbacteria bacterium]|nr:T9SS type A sorting domain-containing protein [Candidatus Eisenbacteria bacterium]